MKIWNVAIYARVSTDKKEQSESISAQVGNLKKWIVEKSGQDKESIYTIVDIYEDEGISGSTFERDAFIRMKNDIDKARINMVITRDLSRFSRNYILAGYYLEDYFKVNNIRFVSILDNVDTETEFDDIIPFKNILNEMYIKDCSKRVRAALTERMQRGSSIASKPPYGYKFEKKVQGKQKNIFLVAQGGETTEIVKKIFELYISGFGVGKIASYLNEKGVAPPSNRNINSKWTNNTIMYILKNPKYGGCMAQQRYKKISYKNKKIKIVPKEEWIIGEEFQGIIEKDTFNYVQELINEKRKNYRYKGEIRHLFSGILKCDECGGGMIYRSKYLGYKCAKSQSGEKRCTSHSVKEAYLIKEVRECIEKYIKNKINREKYFKDLNCIKINNNIQKELSTTIKELSTVDRKFQNLYEDKSKDLLSKRNFNSMISYMQDKQDKLIRRRDELEKIINNTEKNIDIVSVYKQEINKLLDLKVIDRNLIETFVNKITISENKMTGKKFVHIYFKFKE